MKHQTDYDLERRLDRDLEREPTYGRRQRIPLCVDGALRQRFGPPLSLSAAGAAPPVAAEATGTYGDAGVVQPPVAQQRQAIPVIHLHAEVCECDTCRAFDRVDWSDTFAREIGAAK